MLALYNASVQYITAEQHMLGPNHPGLANSQNARIQHFHDSISSMRQDVADSQSLMTQLTVDTPAFTAAQRTHIAGLVSGHMNSAVSAPVSTGSGNAKGQTHLHLHHYMPDSLWCLLRKKDVSWDSKLESMCDFMLQIKCRNGTDATFKVALAIVQLMHEKEMTPSEAYVEVGKLKTKMYHKRHLLPGEQSMQVFPSEVDDFLKIWPRTYQECDPPITSKIDDLRIMEATRKDVMPTRKSNSLITSAASGSRAVAQRGSGGDGTSLELAKMCMGWMMGTQPNNPAPFQGDAHGMRQRNNRHPLAIANTGPLAIMDAPPAVAALPQQMAPTPPAQLQATAAATPDQNGAILQHGGEHAVPVQKVSMVSDLILKGRLALGKAAHGTKKTKKKSLVETLPSDDDGSDANTDGDAGAHTETAALDDEPSDDDPETITPPKSVLKRPAASINAPVLKRPAAAMTPVVEVPPPIIDVAMKPKPSTSPTAYGGGRIYFNKKKNLLRVYLRKGDKIEKTMRVDATDEKLFKKAWTWALKEITSDKRPVV